MVFVYATIYFFYTYMCVVIGIHLIIVWLITFQSIRQQGKRLKTDSTEQKKRCVDKKEKHKGEDKNEKTKTYSLPHEIFIVF